MDLRRGALGLTLLLASGACGGSEDPTPGQYTDNTVPPSPVEPAPSTPPPSAPGTNPLAPPTPDPNAITLPEGDLEKWIWLPIDGTSCADGTQAGVGLNFTSQSRELVIWFQGNGVCYDTISCNMFKGMLVGMGPDPIRHLFWENLDSAEHGPFNRTDMRNPFRKANFVVFPHCALDGHAAHKDTDYIGMGTIHQHGYTNVTEALKRVVPTFKDASRVVVAGFSAGGIGTVANYHQIATAFENVGQPPPFMINDAGPVMGKPYLDDGAQKALRKGWGLDATFLPFCPACDEGGIHLIHEAMWKAHPGMRSALVSTYDDGVAKNLYRLLDKAPGVFNTFHEGLLDFEKWAASKQGAINGSKHRSFFRPGNAHGLIYPDFSANLELADFIDGQLADAPTWSSSTP